MNYQVKTPVTTEPVTLDEVKQHLYLTSGTFAEDTTTYQSIAPANHAVVADYGLQGAAVAVLGKTALVNLVSGACGTGGSIAAKIQESDDDVNWQDFAGGAFTAITEDNDNAVQEIEYTGSKQYIRVVGTVAVASCAFAGDVIVKGGGAVQDDRLLMWITAAREYCENITGRALATQTIEAYLDEFPSSNDIELPRAAPLQSVTSVKYKDSDGDETTMTADTDYITDNERPVGRVVLAYGKTWPSFTAYPVNPIKIRYVAGYTEESPAPKCIKQAILLLVGHWYENREAVMTGAINMTKKIEYAVDSLLAMYRVRWF